MRTVHCLVLLVAASLAGCISNRLRPERISSEDISADYAIVVLSTGAPGACTSTGTELLINPAGGAYLGSHAAYMPVDFSVVKSDFSDHQGFLHVVKLKPGSYYLAPGIANPYVTAVKIPKYDFTVAGGEVVYLGEYFMKVSCVWNTVSEFRDQADRDIAMLKQRNPAFENIKIEKRIPKMSGYAVGGE